MITLKGKTALVTGASRGIGAAIAVDLAKAGADVVINYRHSTDKAMEVQKQIRKQGVNSLVVQADVGKVAEIRRMFDQIKSDWGCVDILVNNAGVVERGLAESFDESAFGRSIDIDLRGSFFCAQQALPGMTVKKWGRVINISSIHEQRPTGYSIVYDMAKGGMLMMMRELALEYSQHGITVNNVAPGAIRTDMNREVLSDPDCEAKVISKIPARFIGEPKDVSKAVVFLASDEARYITGASIVVDGGLSL